MLIRPSNARERNDFDKHGTINKSCIYFCFHFFVNWKFLLRNKKSNLCSNKLDNLVFRILFTFCEVILCLKVNHLNSTYYCTLSTIFNLPGLTVSKNIIFMQFESKTKNWKFLSESILGEFHAMSTRSS